MTKLIHNLMVTLFAVRLAGCTKDPEAGQPGGQAPAQTVTATFELTRDFEQAIEVKATGTEDVSTIKDLWIIPMAPDGSKLLQAPVYIPNGSVKARWVRIFDPGRMQRHRNGIGSVPQDRGNSSRRSGGAVYLCRNIRPLYKQSPDGQNHISGVFGGRQYEGLQSLAQPAYTVNVTLRGQNVSDMRVSIREQALGYTEVRDESRFLLADEDVYWVGYGYPFDIWMPGSGTGTDGSLCLEGWRIPTLKELLLAVAVQDAFSADPEFAKTNTDRYWTSTPSSYYATHRFCFSFYDYTMMAYDKSSYSYKCRLRCVRNTDATARKYPYLSTTTLDGIVYPVIVSRDELGGVAEAALYSAQQKKDLLAGGFTPNYKQGTCLISSKFAVAIKDISTNACPAGWRNPTTREFMLIWAFGAGPSNRSENKAGGGNSIGGEEFLLSSWPAGFSSLTDRASYVPLAAAYNATGNGYVFELNQIQLFATYISASVRRCIKDID